MSCFKRLPPSDADVVAVFQQELARAGAIPSPAGATPPLWLRFAGYYQGLARLPRRARRALQRRWRRSLGGLALLCALGQAPALAATINVDGTSCTLIDAITAANNDAPTVGCSAGSGADTLVLPPESTHTLTQGYDYGPNGLPVVTSAITIAGNGSTITRDPSAPQFRILEVARSGDLTLQETTANGGVSSASGGGVSNFGVLTLTNSKVSGSSTGQYGDGGGVFNNGTLTLTNSTVSGNSAGQYGGGGGVFSNGTLTLTNSTVSGNSAGQYGRGGGVSNYGVLILTNGTVSGNSASGSGGVRNNGTLTLTNSTVSGNSAGQYSAGGVSNYASMATLTNTTVSGNSAADRGGGMFNSGTLTLTNSTLSGNSAVFGGGVYNGSAGYGTVTLIQTLVSGNTVSTQGPEVVNYPGGTYPAGTVIANNLNLFGHDSVAGVTGFTPGPTDLVPSAPLAAILNPTLGDNGGPTKTHALVPASPAADAVAAASCATASDQRGFIRPQDSNADTVADCDIGAFELALPAVETVAADPNPLSRCTRFRCDILIKCNVDQALGTPCTNRIRFFVRERDVRLSEASSTNQGATEAASTTVPRRIRFAFGVANVPPGVTANVRLRLTKRARQIVRTITSRRLRGVMKIRSSAGTLSSTRIRIRLK